MILQALNNYYNILLDDEEAKGKIAPPGYSVANVSYALNLSRTGELLDMFPQYRLAPRGNQMIEKPARLIVPEQPGRQGKTPPPYFLCDKNAYVLGIHKNDEEDPEYSKQRFEAFSELHKYLLQNVDCPEAKAVIKFLENYDPLHGREHPAIAKNLEGLLKDVFVVFMFDGKYIHNQQAIKHVWEKHLQSYASDYVGQCLVTGEVKPIARLHDIKLKGIYPHYGGVTLVGFNDLAYESYNRTGKNGQGLNSPVSEDVTKAYSKTLNYLLSDDNTNGKIVIGDTTVIYWAESQNSDYATLMSYFFQFSEEEQEVSQSDNNERRDRNAENDLKKIAEKIMRGQQVDLRSINENFDENTRFCILGIEAPNRGRAAIRFFYRDPFKKILQNIMQHYDDLKIGDPEEHYPITPYSIVRETVSRKPINPPPPQPLLTGAVFRSILTNTQYPAALYYAIINRIRTEMDDEKRKFRKINYVKAAIIKAYLIRQYRYRENPFKEVLTMALNEQSTIPAYLLGRLFAVLEAAQVEAAKPSKLNATIKDRYFTSACASPASAFPVLLRLSQHHISKAEYGYVYDRRIQEIMQLLDVDKTPYPKRLTLDEQGIFVLGYYHQRAYRKNNNTENQETKN